MAHDAVNTSIDLSPLPGASAIFGLGVAAVDERHVPPVSAAVGVGRVAVCPRHAASFLSFFETDKMASIF